MEILYYPNDNLLKPSEEVTEFNEDLVKLLDSMWNLIKHDGKAMALAAPQISIHKRIFVMKDLNGNRHDVINPIIITTEGSEVNQEGCLSFPGIFIWKERPTFVKIKFKNIKGEDQELSFKKFEARCILHEVDHLDGKLFTEKLNHEQRKELKKRIKQSGRR